MEEDYKEKYKALKKMYKTLEQVKVIQENSKVLAQLEKSGAVIKALHSHKRYKVCSSLSDKLANALKKVKRNEVGKVSKEDELKEENSQVNKLL